MDKEELAERLRGGEPAECRKMSKGSELEALVLFDCKWTGPSDRWHEVLVWLFGLSSSPACPLNI